MSQSVQGQAGSCTARNNDTEIYKAKDDRKMTIGYFELRQNQNNGMSQSENITDTRVILSLVNKGSLDGHIRSATKNRVTANSYMWTV